MAETETHNVITDGSVTAEIALNFVPTHDANGNEVPEDVRKQQAEALAETAAQNEQWKRQASAGLPPHEALPILSSPTIQRPTDEQEDQQEDQQEAATDATGATGTQTPPPPPPTPTPPAPAPGEAGQAPGGGQL